MMNPETVVAFLGNAGIGGILAWYLWYTTSVAQPRQVEVQNMLLNKIIAEFREDMQVERTIRNNLAESVHHMANELSHQPCADAVAKRLVETASAVARRLEQTAEAAATALKEPKG